MECGMERRFRRGFTAAEKTELWDRLGRQNSSDLTNCNCKGFSFSANINSDNPPTKIGLDAENGQISSYLPKLVR